MEYIREVKYSDLNNMKKVGTVDKLRRAAHSQGYDLSDKKTHDKVGSHSVMDLRHRKTGETVKKPDGRNVGGAAAKAKSGSGLDTTTVNTVASAIRADAQKRGRVDKRPAAKAKRKEQAAKNKAAKARDRDPFTRKKTYESFCLEYRQLIN